MFCRFSFLTSSLYAGQGDPQICKAVSEGARNRLFPFTPGLGEYTFQSQGNEKDRDGFDLLFPGDKNPGCGRDAAVFINVSNPFRTIGSTGA